jgi:hypothetical protein
MQSSCYISSVGVKAKLVIVGSEKFLHELMDHTFWHEFIPSFYISQNEAAPITWRVIESENCHFDYQKHIITVSRDQIRSAIVIIEAMFEKKRQENSLYTLHGSLIARANSSSAIGCIGNVSGLGKTTLAAYATKHGWTWVADEKFTILDDKVVGWTNGILRDSKTKSASNGITPNPDSEQYTLRLLCCPIVTSEEFLTRFSMSHEKKMWIYNDEVTRDIRQVNGILTGFQDSLQSFDSQKNARMRLAAVTQLTQTTDGIFLRGNAEVILEEFERILS